MAAATSTGKRSSPIRASRRCTARRARFLWGLMVFSVVYYFLLPIGAAYFQELFRIKVWGPVNVGLVFALSEFVVAWGIAFFYARRANAEFDPMAAEIVRDAEKIGRRP